MTVEIIGKRLKLRPFIKSDIDDYVRWNTIETEWMDWDAPWEENDFNADEYKKSCLVYLENRRQTSIFSSREIEIINTGEHIGRINSYSIDEKYNYTRGVKNLTIGIGIYDSSNRRQGYGTEAWLLYINYLLNNGQEKIYTQTWSGNYPVQALIEKLGFELLATDKDYQIVRGKKVDGFTFKLNKDKFKEVFEEWKSKY